MVYQVKSNRMLNPYLGMKWDERILNPAGNFAYEIPGTIKYWMGQRNSITEYLSNRKRFPWLHSLI